MSGAYDEPGVALVVEEARLAPLSRCLYAATGGLPLLARSAADLLRRRPSGLKLLVVDAPNLASALTLARERPQVRIVLLAPQIGLDLVRAAATEPAILGLVADSAEGPREWELAYLGRRAVAPAATPPSATEILSWGASTITWRPTSSADRARIVEAIEVIGQRFDVPRHLAATAADAAHELLMNAMYDAPVDERGALLFPDRTASITLDGVAAPTLRLVIDTRHLAVEVTDGFGRLARSDLFDSLIRGLTGQVDMSGPGAGIGFARLFSSGSILRAEVTPRETTQVTWIIDRLAEPRGRRNAPRSLYFVSATRPESLLYQILAWSRREGSVKAVERIRIRTLPYAVLEGVNLAKAGPHTECSPVLLGRVRDAASLVVGRACPF